MIPPFLLFLALVAVGLIACWAWDEMEAERKDAQRRNRRR